MSGDAALILVRHGESEWNALDRFAGWMDIGLTPTGREQAVEAGHRLAESGLAPDVVHTSLLRRAIDTAHLMLDAANRHWIPVERTWRLNERHYGALQGHNRAEVRQRYGNEQYNRWRRGYCEVPPPLELGIDAQRAEPRYAGIGGGPASESLQDVNVRLKTYLDGVATPALKRGNKVLVVTHGNTFRALVKHLDHLTDNDLSKINVPLGIPMIYVCDDSSRPIAGSGRFLN